MAQSEQSAVRVNATREGNAPRTGLSPLTIVALVAVAFAANAWVERQIRKSGKRRIHVSAADIDLKRGTAPSASHALLLR